MYFVGKDFSPSGHTCGHDFHACVCCSQQGIKNCSSFNGNCCLFNSVTLRDLCPSTPCLSTPTKVCNCHVPCPMVSYWVTYYLFWVRLRVFRGTRWRSWLRDCATSRKVAGSIPDGVTGIFHWQSFRPQYGPGVDSASNRNEYQKYVLGLKAAGVYGWQTYHLHVLTVLKSGSLHLLEPPGPVQACNVIALPLPTCISNNRLGWADIQHKTAKLDEKVSHCNNWA